MIDLRLDALQDLIGKPYARSARGPDAFDCWGLCAEVYRRAGFTLPDYRDGHLTHKQTSALIKGLAQDHADWIDAPEPWCFVYDKHDGHIGLFVRGYVLHSARPLGVTLQRLEHFALVHPRIAFARWRE